MLGEEPEVHTVTKARERGAILDRNGKILAAATTLYNLSANKTLIGDLNQLVNVLAPILDISESELLNKIQDSKSNFLYLKKKLSENEKDIVKDAIREYGLKGLRLETVANRIYPENALASTLIGYLGDDGKGLTGIEYSLQNILSPPEGTVDAGRNGYTVALTIDASADSGTDDEKRKGGGGYFSCCRCKDGRNSRIYQRTFGRFSSFFFQHPRRTV